MGVFGLLAYWIDKVPDHLKTQETCIEVVEKYPWLLGCLPDHLKTQEMCNEMVSQCSYTLRYVPDHFKTEEMCNKAVHTFIGVCP